MKAIEIHINGVRKCVAGTEYDSVCAALAAAEGTYMLTLFGKSPEAEESSFWLAEPIFLDDEITIRLVEVEASDPPIPMD